MKTPEQYEAEIQVLVDLIKQFKFERSNWYEYTDTETDQEMRTNCNKPEPYMKDFRPSYYVSTDLTPEDVDKTLSTYQTQAELWQRKEAVVQAAIRRVHRIRESAVYLDGSPDFWSYPSEERELCKAVEALEEG